MIYLEDCLKYMKKTKISSKSYVEKEYDKLFCIGEYDLFYNIQISNIHPKYIQDDKLKKIIEKYININGELFEFEYNGFKQLYMLPVNSRLEFNPGLILNGKEIIMNAPFFYKKFNYKKVGEIFVSKGTVKPNEPRGCIIK